jgi:hypothetical protein
MESELRFFGNTLIWVFEYSGFVTDLLFPVELRKDMGGHYEILL